MWNKTVRTLLDEANRRLEHQINLAITRAQLCLRNAIPYLFGGKTLEGLDCSGLVTHCYPRILPDGVEQQEDRLAPWLFTGEDIFLAEPGDLVFFRTSADKSVSTHVGLVEERSSHELLPILHASERCGEIVRSNWQVKGNLFEERYYANSVAKMGPFLFWAFLEDVMKMELRNGK